MLYTDRIVTSYDYYVSTLFC